jgi:hypothetical protein
MARFGQQIQLMEIGGLETLTLPALVVTVGHKRTEVPPEQVVGDDFLQLRAGHGDVKRQK